jgi:DNA repair exonuclease SbcCD ATPase subunit
LFKNPHQNHKILEITDEESLKKENISIENSNQEYDVNIKKLTNLKNAIEYEMTEIDKAYEKVDKETTKSFEIKRENLKKEEEDLKEKLKTEVTKIKEQLENNFSKVNSLLSNSQKIVEGLKSLKKEEKIMIKTLFFISKINKNKREMGSLFQQLMKNIKISFNVEESKIKYEDYYFNGIPIPKDIEFKDVGINSFKVLWKIDDINILNVDKKEIKYRIEIRKENSKEDFIQIYEGNENNFLVNNKIKSNTNYEIRICSIYKDIY